MTESSVSDNSTQEVRYILRSTDAALYTVLLRPRGEQPSQVALFCPPVFEEHAWAYPVMRECARRLGACGVASLRFDYVGTGDSAGSGDGFSMRSAISDIAFLCSWLADRFPEAQLVPIGVRLGARFLLDAWTSTRGSGPAAVAPPILWDPVLDANSYIFADLRRTLAGAMIVYQAAVACREDIVRETLDRGCCVREGLRLNQIDGYPVTADLLRDVAAVRAGDWSYAEPVSVLVTDRTGNASRRRTHLEPALPGMKLTVVRDVPYWFQQPVYRQTREPLFRATQQCLEQCR